jgi:hypothetical protein
VLEQLVAGEDLSRPAHERLEERELLSREPDRRLAAPNLARGGVETEVADLEHGRPLDRAAPVKRPQTREQLGEGERLRQEVVGPGVEPGHAILDGAACRQHQHRSPDPTLAQLAADLHAVEPGKHEVEDDGVVLDRGGHPERVVARARDVRRVALLDQPAPQQAGHLQLVFDDEDAHGPIVAPAMRVR